MCHVLMEGTRWYTRPRLLGSRSSHLNWTSIRSLQGEGPVSCIAMVYSLQAQKVLELSLVQCVIGGFSCHYFSFEWLHSIICR